MADREGFEPSRRLVTVYALSRRAPSAARPPVQKGRDYNYAAPRRNPRATLEVRKQNGMRAPPAPASRLLLAHRLGTYGRLECYVDPAERIPRRGRPLVLVTGVVMINEPTSGIDIAADVSPANLVEVRALLVIL